MKTLKYILGILAVAAGLSSCVGDLDVTPIDPAMNTADKALTDADDYFGLLAQCYTGFATSGSYGPNGANNISGVDGGFSQYYRGRRIQVQLCEGMGRQRIRICRSYCCR